MIPSSRQSGDTEVSRWAIAAWASRTEAFDSANVLPPVRPRGREPGQSAFADQLPLELGQRRAEAEHEKENEAVVAQLSAEELAAFRAWFI